MWGGGGNFCPRCDKRVYYAEEVIAIGKHWHKSCFLCASPECHKRLDSRSCTDHDGEAYCQHCYKRLFGPKGYGFGVGAGTLSMDTGDEREDQNITSNVSSYARAQAAPLIDSNGQVSSPKQTTPTSPKQPFMPLLGGGPLICPRCSKTVYDAEKMMGGGSAWHKLTCFTCVECNRRLESTTLCEREGELYCKTCYGRNFGPKGYGYGVGAGTLQMQQ
uniref:LIM zinc-binding domain-containing protein n=1 Tax=Plectus sambesii TaxID=2011161 RepID=A0A914UJR1_9BILA